MNSAEFGANVATFSAVTKNICQSESVCFSSILFCGHCRNAACSDERNSGAQADGREETKLFEAR